MTPTIVAGVDIGNSTTEVVIVDATQQPPRPLAWDRTLTRGAKGSTASIGAAAQLVTSLANRHKLSVEQARVCRLRPVSTRALVVQESKPDLGQFRILTAGSPTPGTAGFGIGRPLLAHASANTLEIADHPVVALFPAGFGFRRIAQTLNAATEGGAQIVAALLADDEAVLVSSRIKSRMPIVDGVDLIAASRARLVAVEVAASGGTVAQLADVLALSSAFGVGPRESEPTTVAEQLFDASCAVVAHYDGPMHPVPEAPGWFFLRDGRRTPLERIQAEQNRVGEIESPDGSVIIVDDVTALDLRAIAVAAHARGGSTEANAVVAAMLHHEHATAAADQLSHLLNTDVVELPNEWTATQRGSLTTPGATPDTAVIDIGGGTIDLIAGSEHAIVAGAGELLTLASSKLLNVNRGIGEWAKRGRCQRAETPHLLVGEDGARTWAPSPVPARYVGNLVVSGPAGWLGISPRLAASEWRAVRLALKDALLGDVLSRAIPHSNAHAGRWVVCGGGAGDDEIVAALSRVLPGAAAVGRANVAGELGHRFAVAYGLTLSGDEG